MDKKTLGVVVGRFQSSHLHKGYLHLLTHAMGLCDELLILIGETSGAPDKNNPLSYESRRSMIKTELYRCNVPFNRFAITIDILRDNPCDIKWSEILDDTIAKHSSNEDEVILIGSRDSFLPHYKGLHKTVEIKNAPAVSSSDVRSEVLAKSHEGANQDFYEGIIYAHKNMYPTAFPAVDICVFDKKDQKYNSTAILLGKKPNEDKWRFPGGHVDPEVDKSFEEAALRELREECGINLEVDKNVKYIKSLMTDDHRYRKSEHGIITSLFVTEYCFGSPTAGDDLIDVSWFLLQDIDINRDIMKVHTPLIEEVFKYFDQQTKETK